MFAEQGLDKLLLQILSKKARNEHREEMQDLNSELYE